MIQMQKEQQPLVIEPREVMNLVVTGHVDHGKSTVIGRLLAETGSLEITARTKARRAARIRIYLISIK